MFLFEPFWQMRQKFGGLLPFFRISSIWVLKTLFTVLIYIMELFSVQRVWCCGEEWHAVTVRPGPNQVQVPFPAFSPSEAAQSVLNFKCVTHS